MTVKAKLVQGGDGTAIPAGFVGETVTTASEIATTDFGTSFADIPNATITLNKGRWAIRYEGVLRASPPLVVGGINRAIIRLTDNSGNKIGKSDRVIIAVSQAANSTAVYAPVSCEVIVDVTSDSTIYKLQGKKVETGGTTSSNGIYVAADTCDAQFVARRIA